MMAVVLAGCAPMRFSDREILWKDPDDKPIAVPAPRDPPYHWIAMRDAVFDPADQVLAHRLHARGGERQRARRDARLELVDRSAARAGAGAAAALYDRRDARAAPSATPSGRSCR